MRKEKKEARIRRVQRLFRDILGFSIDKYYHWYETLYKNIYTARFSNNASRLLYDSNTVTYIMIQLAAYMGFNEIYLLGVDCNYKQERNYL